MKNSPEKKKEVKKGVRRERRSKDVYFTNILRRIRGGGSPYDQRFLKNFNVTKQAINPFVKELKQQNVIYRDGYGVWKLTGKEVKKGVRSPKGGSGPKSKTNLIRAHGFNLTLRIPEMSFWRSRRSLLYKKNINFLPVNAGNVPYEQFVLMDWTVRLYDRSIVFMCPKGWSVYAEKGVEAYDGFVRFVHALFRAVESFLRLKRQLKINNVYKFKVTKAHYAFVNNALAHTFRQHNEVLSVYDKKGQWLLVDFSLGVPEFEIVRNDLKIVGEFEDWFNDFKEVPLTTKPIDQFMKNQREVNEVFLKEVAILAENQKAHNKIYKNLARVSDELINKLERL